MGNIFNSDFLYFIAAIDDLENLQPGKQSILCI